MSHEGAQRAKHLPAPLLLLAACALHASALHARAQSFQWPEPVLQTGHYALVNVMQFSPDGKLLLTAVGDDTLKLWDVASGREVRTLPCEAHSLAVSPDGRRIVCASYGDTFTTVRDAQTGQEVAKLEGSNRLARVVAFSPDGKMIDRGSD